MKPQLISRNAGRTGLMAGSVLLLISLAACNREPPLQAAIVAPRAAVAPAEPASPPVAPPAAATPAEALTTQAPVQPPAVAPDDYVYYPQYEIYSSSNRHQYAYQHAGVWIWVPVPPEITVNELLASPAVPMEFHDELAPHHEAVAKKYPRDWTPPLAAK
jgi:hypothetical protein